MLEFALHLLSLVYILLVCNTPKYPNTPPLVGGGGGLVFESVGKADLLSDHFDGKQSRESVDLPLTCHPSPSLN